MNKSILNIIAAALSALFISASGNAQSPFHGKEHLFTVPHYYTVFQTQDSITVDGVADERSWQNAPWSSYFTDIEGDLKPRPPLATRFKMLWDNHHLYVHAELEEPHLWGTLTKHDEIVYNNNDFEIFIDPDGDTHQYYEIEVNILKTIFDLYMDKPYRNGGKAHINWNAANIQTGIAMNGTLNKPDDTDNNWMLEMAIPFTSLRKDKPTSTPQNNTVWRMNFSRVQWDLLIKDNQYERKKDANHKLLPEHNWVWSPQGVINMHFPERWGYVIFSDSKSGDHTFTIPISEFAKQYLWLIYYNQKDYFANHKTYATNLTLLGFSSDSVTIENETFTMMMDATRKEFTATIRFNKTNEQWQVNHEGLTTESKSNR
jgi:Carbohydrate family 9 binding domain-like